MGFNSGFKGLNKYATYIYFIHVIFFVMNYVINNTVGQSHARETNSSSAGQNISSSIWNLMVHCHV